MPDNTRIQTIYPSVLDYLNLRCLFWVITFPKAKKVEQGERGMSVANLKGWVESNTVHVCASMPVPAVQGGKDKDGPEVTSGTFDCTPHSSHHVPIPFSFPSPKSKPSLFCPKSVHPSLLLKSFSFPAFLTNTCCSPSLPTPAHLLFAESSSSLGRLHLLDVSRLCLRPNFPGSLLYLSHPCSLLQLLSASCCSCCPSPFCPYCHG